MPEHAVLIVVTSIVDADAGLDAIEDALSDALVQAGAGEFDGNEIGPDGAVLSMYGPDADALWDAVEAIVRSAPIGSGSHAIKRYGQPGAGEVRVELRGA